MQKDEAQQYNIGGGRKSEVEIKTHGQVRFRVKNTEPAVECAVVTADPDSRAGFPTYFFRTSGGKEQFCIRFSSGVVQVLATEV